MWKKAITLLLLAGTAGWMLGCSGLSQKARSQVTYAGTFAQLQADPQKTTGETVLLGGKIITARVMDKATELTVLQLDLGGSDRPMDNDQSKGRFLIRSSGFLDPAIYPDGTLITVVGKLTGSEEREIGQMPYRYPIIDPVEIKKWPPQADNTPRFHIGIGVGKTF